MSKAHVFLCYNEKGGVGKSTMTGMLSYLTATAGYKVLDVDLDPQHNLTDMIAATYQDGKHFHPAQALYLALENNNLRTAICNVNKHLDIAPSDLSLVRFQKWDNKIAAPVNDEIIAANLKPFLDKYDFIFLDVPPTFNPFSLNAIYAATDLLLVIQTQHSSYTSALDTVSMIDALIKQYHFKVNLLGVVLYLMVDAKEDHDVKTQAQQMFGDLILNNNIEYQERVKGFTDHGVTNKDYWDKRSIGMYRSLAHEIIGRLKK